jgi:hypothetical protein
VVVSCPTALRVAASTPLTSTYDAAGFAAFSTSRTAGREDAADRLQAAASTRAVAAAHDRQE